MFDFSNKRYDRTPLMSSERPLPLSMMKSIFPLHHLLMIVNLQLLYKIEYVHQLDPIHSPKHLKNQRKCHNQTSLPRENARDTPSWALVQKYYCTKICPNYVSLKQHHLLYNKCSTFLQRVSDIGGLLGPVKIYGTTGPG